MSPSHFGSVTTVSSSIYEYKYSGEERILKRTAFAPHGITSDGRKDPVFPDDFIKHLASGLALWGACLPRWQAGFFYAVGAALVNMSAAAVSAKALWLAVE